MKYMGSKSRIAKYIIPIMEEYRSQDQWFIDMFCGGCNLLDKVDGKRIGNDKNKYLIALWQGLIENRDRPYNICKSLYITARDVYNGKETTLEMDDFMVGWIGWMASYNGRFFDGGYSGHEVGATKRNYISEQIRNTESQIEKLKDVVFTNKSYEEFNLKEPCLIYCDIPYKDTKQYLTSKDFNHGHFWQWCRDMTKKGHIVFISEYDAPDDFECVWQMEVTNSMNQTDGKI